MSCVQNSQGEKDGLTAIHSCKKMWSHALNYNNPINFWNLSWEAVENEHY